MKKMLLASAFALIGTFAMANETETEDKQDVTSVECWDVSVERCGVGFVYEDCGPLGDVIDFAVELYEEMEVYCN
ncbi:MULTISPECIES: hypothetical protein [Empedobacter]|uniref:Uncharacterized protein n=2 Tax=Empedobacter TaxID=59734 RepID=A0A3R8SS13_9FLAO|nr:MULTISPECIES: hypothetical protein [Empedobacter]MBW1617989.1 hypothetical protein [Empedobacter falsenii]MDH1602884.1 hypothetical protein [Empedobacter sp. GD03739]MDM1040722.1 hypothetical protein [Empedobacter brevis]MDM1135503.1 hypothetical protein [Empedobacter sp. R750]RRT91997.1 hypothetical protein EGI89_07105 [Empedobacter falsenii]